MIRFLFRTIAVFCLAAAVMFAVIDATQSVGVSEIVLTPLMESWSATFPQSFEDFIAWAEQTAPNFVTEQILAIVLGLPTSLVFAGLAALLYLLGYQRPKRASQFLRS